MSTNFKNTIDKLAIRGYNQDKGWRFVYKEVNICTQIY